jgi:hypothetical protein
VKRFWLCALPLMLLTACTVSYKLNMASIDYTLVKSITIKDFPNQATLVYAPLSQLFTEQLKEKFITQTKLKMIPRDGDLQLEGEIVGYDLTPMATQSDGYASETKLNVTVKVRYTNTTKTEEDFEQDFSAYRTFSATQSLESVQDQLLEEISKEIAESIFNKTVANW